MREIKFRAWNIKSKQMRYGAENDVVDLEEKPELIEATGGFRFATFFGVAPHDKNIVLMQFTGLHDKNGKEIYEGDIVTTGEYELEKPQIVDTNTAGIVKWFGEENYPAFDIEGNDMETNLLSYLLHEEEIEIIGNIYENPELLTISAPASSDAAE